MRTRESRAFMEKSHHGFGGCEPAGLKRVNNQFGWWVEQAFYQLGQRGG
ncbi:hypothetical protein [Salibacterium qingdaonense]|nr:hypothetical protein [Salibacterium qingdaonense]